MDSILKKYGINNRIGLEDYSIPAGFKEIENKPAYIKNKPKNILLQNDNGNYIAVILGRGAVIILEFNSLDELKKLHPSAQYEFNFDRKNELNSRNNHKYTYDGQVIVISTETYKSGGVVEKSSSNKTPATLRVLSTHDKRHVEALTSGVVTASMSR